MKMSSHSALPFQERYTLIYVFSNDIDKEYIGSPMKSKAMNVLRTSEDKAKALANFKRLNGDVVLEMPENCM